MITVSIVLSAFVLSVVASLTYIWTQRRGMADPATGPGNPYCSL